MARVTIQTGHVNGEGGSEAEMAFVQVLAPCIQGRLRWLGHDATVVDALGGPHRFVKVPPGQVFVSLHTDWSSNEDTRGASVGYEKCSDSRFDIEPDPLGKALAQSWKDAYKARGWRGGFLEDNYTGNMSCYYMWRRTRGGRPDPPFPDDPDYEWPTYDYRFLAEHGFLKSNVQDRQWLWSHIDDCAGAHADAIRTAFGPRAGIDRADAPTVTEALAIRESTGADWWGVYIGGPCSAGSDWTGTLVKELADNGFVFLPIYVGQQTTSVCAKASNLTRAQGDSDGKEAARLMIDYGWDSRPPSQGSFIPLMELYLSVPICLDVESETYDAQPVATLEYVAGWVAAVREVGYAPVVYSSPRCLSALGQLPLGFAPDYVWVASWLQQGGQGEVDPSLDPDEAKGMPEGSWQDRRAWQYAGEVIVDGATTPVDISCSELPLAPRPGARWPLALLARYDVSPPVRWAPGEARNYTITVINEGCQTWKRRDEFDSEGVRIDTRVRLGVHFGTDSDKPADGWATDQRFELPKDIRPGESFTMSVNVRPPSTVGPRIRRYVLRHRMVKEDVKWFDQIHKTNVGLEQVVIKKVVSAKANIFGAGHLTSPDPGGGGGGVLPPFATFPATPGKVLTFSSIAGTVTYYGNGPHVGPDGEPGGSTDIFSFGGLAGIVNSQSAMFLVGVFLKDQEPAGPAPPRLDFSPGVVGQEFGTLAPQLNQVFFIGDGLTDTGTGATQRFVVPGDATRLFLGFADGYAFHGDPGWYDDNTGQFNVEFRIQ